MFNSKVMSQEELKNFVSKISRSEMFEMNEKDKIRYYYKAIKVTLIALGYDEKWVMGEFSNYLENYSYK